MKKIINNTSLISLVMSILLILGSFDYFAYGKAYILVGIFSIISGLGLLLVAVLDYTNKESGILSKVKHISLLALYPLFIFSQQLIIVILNAKYLGVVDWIFRSLLILDAIVIITCTIAAQLNSESPLLKVLRISVLAFIAVIAVLIVLSTSTIGGLPLQECILLAGYFFIAKACLDNKKETE